MANTAQLDASSYIWRPWFGNWRGRAAVTYNQTYAERDTRIVALTGSLNGNLFHRSHFPLNAYANVTDTRVEIDTADTSGSAVRTINMGLVQNYRDDANNTSYMGVLQSDIQTQDSGLESFFHHLLVSGEKRAEQHSFSGVASLNHATSNAGTKSLVGQVVLNHGFRPSRNLTVANGANFAFSESASSIGNVGTMSFGANTRAGWRAEEMPLEVDGRAAIGVSVAEVPSATGVRQVTASDAAMQAGARYDVTEQLSVSSNVALDLQQNDGEEFVGSVQTVSANYAGIPVPFGSYVYSWNTGAAGSNETASGEQSVQLVNASAGHSLTRGWVDEYAGLPVTMTFNVGQDVIGTARSNSPSDMQLNNRVSFGAASSDGKNTGNLQLSALGLHSVQEDELQSFYSLNTAMSLSRSINRYRSVGASLAHNVGATGSRGIERIDDSGSATVFYVDNRLFDVRRLVLKSELETRMGGLLFNTGEANASTESLEMALENRLVYQIGLLYVEGRTIHTYSQSGLNAVYLINLARHFL